MRNQLSRFQQKLASHHPGPVSRWGGRLESRAGSIDKRYLWTRTAKRGTWLAVLASSPTIRTFVAQTEFLPLLYKPYTKELTGHEVRVLVETMSE